MEMFTLNIKYEISLDTVINVKIEDNKEIIEANYDIEISSVKGTITINGIIHDVISYTYDFENYFEMYNLLMKRITEKIDSIISNRGGCSIFVPQITIE